MIVWKHVQNLEKGGRQGPSFQQEDQSTESRKFERLSKFTSQESLVGSVDNMLERLPSGVRDKVGSIYN